MINFNRFFLYWRLMFPTHRKCRLPLDNKSHKKVSTVRDKGRVINSLKLTSLYLVICLKIVLQEPQHLTDFFLGPQLLTIFIW